MGSLDNDSQMRKKASPRRGGTGTRRGGGLAMVRDGLDALGAARPHGREGAPSEGVTPTGQPGGRNGIFANICHLADPPDIHKNFREYLALA